MRRRGCVWVCGIIGKLEPDREKKEHKGTLQDTTKKGKMIDIKRAKQ